MKKNNKNVAVFDFHDGGAGQIGEWFEKVTGYHIACFVLEASAPLEIDVESEKKKRVSQRTEFPAKGTFKGRPLIVSLDWVKELKRRNINKVLPLTPDNRKRLRQVKMCQELGIELVSAVHPSVIILDQARIAPGVWINAGSLIGYKSEIESGVIINTGSQIDHHNVLMGGCHVSPGVLTAGFVTLRQCCYVYTGAVIVNRVEIGEDAIVGAGSVVLSKVSAGCTVVGSPARIIRDNSSKK